MDAANIAYGSFFPFSSPPPPPLASADGNGRDDRGNEKETQKVKKKIRRWRNLKDGYGEREGNRKTKNDEKQEEGRKKGMREIRRLLY